MGWLVAADGRVRGLRPARGRLAAATALAALLAACAHPGPPSGRPGAEGRGAETGIASFYADALQGRRTASGAPYDGREMTCAHRTLPFGTRLRVTDVETGRSVVVTVTDRGPYAEGRIIDLSRAAARARGIRERGLARVRLELLR